MNGLKSMKMEDDARSHGLEAIPIEINKAISALNTQEGGSHYKKLAIEPVEFIYANDIPFMEGNCIKYLCRHKNKNGAEDIKKVIHYCQLILELEYGEEGDSCQNKHEGCTCAKGQCTCKDKE